MSDTSQPPHNSRSSDRLMHPPPQERTRALPKHVVTLAEVAPARELLRAQHHTIQAGFTAERIPQWLFAHRPILMDDGPSHDEHRKQLSRFFAPRILDEQHGEFIRHTAARMVQEAQASGTCHVDDLALRFTVEVTSRIVGLTHSRTPRLARRLTNFFRQPPVDHTQPDHGRTTREWIRAARKALGPIISLYLADVRPAIRARKRQPRGDIISHLLERGYSSREILMECLTYGTAGMVTTREFIAVSLWHLLQNRTLREQYERADEAERHAILAEIIRLEPPVGHLYRRVVTTDQPPSSGCPYAPGTLVDIDVRATNIDERVYGTHAQQVCPERDITGADRFGLSFGDGAHRCPGSPLALRETDALLLELLRAKPFLVQEPVIKWDTLVEGYQLRDFTVTFAPASE